MRASRFVQSPRKAATSGRERASTTAGAASAVRSLTWQLKHQAAVKSSITVLPESRASATASGDQARQSAFRGAAVAESMCHRIQINQALVTNIGTERTRLRTSIHLPGWGSQRISAGQDERKAYGAEAPRP